MRGNRAAVAVVVLVGGLMNSSPARADHFAGATGAVATCTGSSGGLPGNVVMSDNSTWTWWYEDINSAPVAAALDWARDALYQPRPNLEVQMVGSLTANTDMEARDSDYGVFCGIDFETQT